MSSHGSHAMKQNVGQCKLSRMSRTVHPADHTGHRVYLKKVPLKSLGTSRYDWEYAQVCDLPDRCFVLAFLICGKVVWALVQRSRKWRLVPMYKKTKEGFVAMQAGTHTRVAEHHADATGQQEKLLATWPGAQALLDGFDATGDTKADLNELARLGRGAPPSVSVVYPLQDLGTTIPYWWSEHAPARMLQESTGDDSCSGRDGMNAECDGKMDPITQARIDSGRGCCVRSPSAGRRKPGKCFDWDKTAQPQDQNTDHMSGLHRWTFSRPNPTHPITNEPFTMAAAFNTCTLHAAEARPDRSRQAKKLLRHARHF